MSLMAVVIIGVFSFYVYRERELRTDLVHHRLLTINDRIINAYEQNLDLDNYLQFISQFYEDSIFEELRVTVYDSTGNVINSLGKIIPADIQNHNYVSDPSREGETGKTRLGDDSRQFYISQFKSADGLITVFTALPLTTSVEDALKSHIHLWYIAIAIVLIVTLVAYYSTRLLTRNILILRDFARKASSGEPIDSNYDFPHDELGDISREIVTLYNDKVRATKAGYRERAVAINAINEKARIKRQLTSNINHELKTPIGVIGGYIDTILADPDMTDEMRTRFLERARKNVDRLQSLIEDVSTMNRLEDGGNITLEEIDFHDMVFQINSGFDASKIATTLKFSYDIPIVCRVRANENILHGALLNLIRNAGLHSHGTAVCLKLISESDRFYTFSFSDNGVGVPEESLPRLFERFYRVDKGRSRKIGGTGLGLSIVQKSFKAMGGTISVQNRSEGGLEFIFTLVKWGASASDKSSPIE